MTETTYPQPSGHSGIVITRRIPARRCAHPGCPVWLLSQADNDRCRKHRNRCGCGDRTCGYGARRPF